MNLTSQIAAVGERLVDVMIDAGRMKPDADVLDIVCGPGRTAAPLSRYLDPDRGRYEGFDVMPESISWCQKAITRRHPNFRFQLADLHNAQYNPDGSQRACEYDFPYGDAGFDVAVAASLFTHLRPFEARRYLEETARVLRPGGRLLGTWYLLNDESRELVATGRPPAVDVLGEQRRPLSLYEFTDEHGFDFSSAHPDVPEHMIVADEEMVRDLHERAGLRIAEVRYGRWAGRDDRPGRFGQDLLIAERT
jgi:SAM-dependent methyltransferase